LVGRAFSSVGQLDQVTVVVRHWHVIVPTLRVISTSHAIGRWTTASNVQECCLFSDDPGYADGVGSGETDALTEFRPGPVAQVLTRVARDMLTRVTAADLLEQVVQVALRVLPGAEGVSVTLRGPSGDFHTPITTDPLAAELDQIQYDAGEGPCVDIARAPDRTYVHSENLATQTAWPHFGPAASERGYSAVLSVALFPGTRPPAVSGALNLYARLSGGGFDQEALDTALLLASHASLALAGTSAVTNAELRETQLRQAIDSRDLIGQAKGILMERYRITAEQAFEWLRRVSQDTNIKITELARRLTDDHA
jgi:hypothetical protein